MPCPDIADEGPAIYHKSTNSLKRASPSPLLLNPIISQKIHLRIFAVPIILEVRTSAQEFWVERHNPIPIIKERVKSEAFITCSRLKETRVNLDKKDSTIRP